MSSDTPPNTTPKTLVTLREQMGDAYYFAVRNSDWRYSLRKNASKTRDIALNAKEPPTPTLSVRESVAERDIAIANAQQMYSDYVKQPQVAATLKQLDQAKTDLDAEYTPWLAKYKESIKDARVDYLDEVNKLLAEEKKRYKLQKGTINRFNTWRRAKALAASLWKRHTIRREGVGTRLVHNTRALQAARTKYFIDNVETTYNEKNAEILDARNSILGPVEDARAEAIQNAQNSHKDIVAGHAAVRNHKWMKRIILLSAATESKLGNGIGHAAGFRAAAGVVCKHAASRVAAHATAGLAAIRPAKKAAAEAQPEAAPNG